MRLVSLNTFAFFISIALLGLVQCKPIPDNSGNGKKPSTVKLDSLGQSIIQGGGVVGFSVAIMKSSDTLYNKGFGFVDTTMSAPVTQKTRFKIASISKLMGSTVVMKLAEEGRLSLDQTLFELLPDFPKPEQAQKITLAHMISHTSGLAEYATLMDTIYVRTGKMPEKKDYYDFFNNNDLIFEPGTNYSYCNSGFVLMGMIVENITKNSLQGEFDRIINKPSEMDLRLIAEAASLPEMSPYWEKKGSRFIPYPHWPWIKGDGGLTATSIMLAQFPKYWTTGKIINQESFNEMKTPRTLTDGVPTGYGLGVRNGELFGEKIIGHTGGHKSTYAIMAHFPERDLTFVVLANTDNTPISARNIFGQFAAAYLGYDTSDISIQRQKLGNPTDYLGTYTGFDSKIEEKIQIKDDGDKLMYCYGDTCYPMTYLGNHKFWIERWPYDHVIFEVDETGKALALKEYYTGFYAILRKRTNLPN